MGQKCVSRTMYTFSDEFEYVMVSLYRSSKNFVRLVSAFTIILGAHTISKYVHTCICTLVQIAWNFMWYVSLHKYVAV